MRLVKPRVGYTDLMGEPEDGRRYEIYDGDVFVVPSPAPPHQVAVCNLLVVLHEYVLAEGGFACCAPLDLVLSEYNVLQPDLLYFRRERSHLIAPEQWDPIRVPPDLVVEVLSTSTASRDRGPKLQLYARYGVPEYWIVDPYARTIEVLQLQDGVYASVAVYAEGESAEPATLAGLWFAVRDVFELPTPGASTPPRFVS